MRPLTFSLQYRGLLTGLGDDRRKEARAPGCALITRLTSDGPAARFEWAAGEDEALLETRLTFHDERHFDEEGTIVFAVGTSLRIRGRGWLAPCADPELRHGSVVWTITGGDGLFDRSSGLITSNFLLSATGDLTENQLAVVFAPGAGSLTRASPDAARNGAQAELGASQKSWQPPPRQDRAIVAQLNEIPRSSA